LLKDLEAIAKSHTIQAYLCNQSLAIQTSFKQWHSYEFGISNFQFLMEIQCL